MTAGQFRKIALSLPEARELAHMGHPDFRVRGKIFATLGAPDKGWAMVKLPPAEQRVYIKDNVKTFVPAQGAWGLQGATLIRLSGADPEMVREAVTVAWRTTAAKSRPQPAR